MFAYRLGAFLHSDGRCNVEEATDPIHETRVRSGWEQLGSCCKGKSPEKRLRIYKGS